METINKLDAVEKDRLEIILQEFADEQKSAIQKQDDVIKAFNALSGKVNNFEETLKNQKVIVPEPDFKQVNQMIEKGKEEIKQIVEMALRRIRADHWRIFLESDAKKWAVYLLVSLAFLTYLYCFFIHFTAHK